MLFYLSAYGCDPADPAYMFLDFNDNNRDGALNLDEWMTCKTPQALKIASDLCTRQEFKRLEPIITVKLALMSEEVYCFKRLIGKKILAPSGRRIAKT